MVVFNEILRLGRQGSWSSRLDCGDGVFVQQCGSTCLGRIYSSAYEEATSINASSYCCCFLRSDCGAFEERVTAERRHWTSC